MVRRTTIGILDDQDSVQYDLIEEIATSINLLFDYSPVIQRISLKRNHLTKSCKSEIKGSRV